MENVKIQDKNKRDNVKYMHVNGLNYDLNIWISRKCSKNQ